MRERVGKVRERESGRGCESGEGVKKTGVGEKKRVDEGVRESGEGERK